MEKQEQIIRRVTQVGNGAHIFAPKEWLNEEVVIIRTRPKLTIKEEVMKLLSDYMEDILGIYLVGSYGREEHTERSDIDVLVISESINKRIESGKYSILIMPKSGVEKELETSALPIIPMLREAKPLLNSILIEGYKKAKLTERNLKFHIETTKSALRVHREFIELAKIDKEKISDYISYSLILRLRGVYIVDCLIKNKLWNNKEFIGLVKKIAGSKEAYEGYLRSKDNKKTEKNLKIEEAERIYDYVLKKIGEQKKWVKGKR